MDEVNGAPAPSDTIGAGGAAGAGSAPLAGMVVTRTRLAFDELLQRLERAVEAHGLLLIAKPSASRNAAARGIHIPGNAMILTYSSDFAVRTLAASVAAGFEAPMRLYVTESSDHTASVSYRQPSTVFAPYGAPELAEVGADLDRVFAQIVADATGR